MMRLGNWGMIMMRATQELRRATKLSGCLRCSTKTMGLLARAWVQGNTVQMESLYCIKCRLHLSKLPDYIIPLDITC